MNLIRVDDRLIHGQVAVGWASHINPKYMIISDDEIAQSKEDSELYLLGVPFEYEGRVFSIEGTVKFLNSLKSDGFILVMRTLQDALDIYNSGYKFTKLNIGGLHLAKGKKEINHYLFIDENDIEILQKLNELGVEIIVQDLPTNSKYSIDYILNKWKNK